MKRFYTKIMLFTVAICLGLVNTQAQAPGGVTTGLQLWVKASTPPGTTTTWNDLSGSGHDLLLQGGVQSTVSNAYNFNPAVTFNGTTHWMRAANVLATSTTPGSVYSVQNNRQTIGSGPTTGNGKQIFSFGNNNPGVEYVLTAGSTTSNRMSYQRPNGNGKMDYDVPTQFSSNTNLPVYQSLVSFTWDYSSGTSMSSNTSGHNGANRYAFTQATPISNQWYALGLAMDPVTGAMLTGPLAVNEYYEGDMAENIVYSVNHIPGSPERTKIDSYLGLKYGITLLNGGSDPNSAILNYGTYQYTSSTGKVIWNGAGGSTYHFNVAGIGRDDNSALTQKQSKSMNTVPNNQVTIGLGGIAVNNLSNTNTFANNNSFLVWGDNNNQSSLAAASVTFAHNGFNFNKRMTRIWRVENNGDNPMTQTVKIQFPMASVGTTTLTGEGSCAQYVIIYSLDETFDANDPTAVLTVNGSNYEVNHKFPAGVSYFTFAKVNQTAPGTVDLPKNNETPNFTSPCLKAVGWKYYYYDAALTRKAFAINWNGNIEPAGVNGVLTYSATPFSVTSGANTCNIMGRLLEILPAGGNFTAGGGVKVRIFFSPEELSNSLVTNILSQRWFKYPGNASATQAANTGQNITGATFLTPATTGEEDGIDFVEFNGIQSFSTFGFASNTGVFPLPVKLSSFEANKKGNTADLKWVTASEQNNQGFDIERSTDGRTWTKIGFVASGSVNGNSSTALQYNFTDNNTINGQNFYRLKQIDFDGNYDYSDARNLLFSIAGGITIYPNPAQDIIHINGLEGNETIALYNATGKLVQQQKAVASVTALALERLSAGTYYIRITGKDGKTNTHTFVKQSR